MANECNQLGATGFREREGAEEIIMSATRVANTTAEGIDVCTMGKLAEKLIFIIEAPYLSSSDLRRRACQLVSELASSDLGALNLLIESGRLYAQHLKIDDSDPWGSNAIEAIGNVHRPDDVAIRFLAEVARKDTGLARYEAINALRALNDPRANEILDSIGGRASTRQL
jgi:hypothetical protein